MTCEEFIRFLLEYVEGSLTAEERARFDEHLGDCDDCTAYLRTYEVTIRMEKTAARLDPKDAPEELVQAVLAARAGERNGNDL